MNLEQLIQQLEAAEEAEYQTLVDETQAGGYDRRKQPSGHNTYG